MTPTTRRRLLALALATTAALARAAPSRACGGDPETGPVYVNARHPDLPLQAFAAGRVGVIPDGGAWRRGDLVVAWRALTDAPLDDEERAGFVRHVRRSHRHVDPRAIDPSVPVDEAPPDEGGYDPDPSVWRNERAAAVGAPGPEIASGWWSHGAATNNCLGDAFRAAAEALRARLTRDATSPDAVRAWIDAQDAVFSNCGDAPGRVPSELSSTTTMEQRRDRAYQIAAAHFYAGRYDEAERRFRAVADDAASPWSPVARYLVVRSLTRAAQRGREAPDLAALARAHREASALLDDSAAAPVHAMTRRYRGWLGALYDPASRAHELGVALARPGLGAGFEQALGDYVRVLDSTRADAFARQHRDPDRLTTWLAVLASADASLGETARTAALSLYQRTGARAWLVAALLSAGDARDPRLAPALDAARLIPRGDVAYATAHYHRLRVLVERGEPVYDEVLRVAGTLTDDDGPTARNLFRELAARVAPDVERMVALAHGRPAGWDGGEGVTLPSEPGARVDAPEDFSPVGASALSQRVPLAALLRAARTAGLPAMLRDRIIASAVLRAALLDDETALLAATALVTRASPDVARALRPVTEAPDRDLRRFAMLSALGYVSVTSAALDARVDGDFWATRCDGAVSAVEPARFLTAPERAAWSRERARLVALGGATTFFAAEAARLARALPRDPRMPALLASAVSGTRNNGCARGAPVHAASRAAFQALHRLYEGSPEARATPFWY